MKLIKQSIGKWLLLSLLCLLTGYLLGNFRLDINQDNLKLIEAKLNSVSGEKNQLLTQIAGMEAEKIVEQQTIKWLTEENKELYKQINQLNNKLYFYQRVVAPELQASGVQIDSFVVDKEAETGKWKYELVLMQAQKRRRFLTGRFTMNFSFYQGDEHLNIPLSKLCDSCPSGFKFKYFQTIKGYFTLPDGAEMEAVSIKLNVPGSRGYKAQELEQHFNWQTLVHGNKLVEQLSDDNT